MPDSRYWTFRIFTDVRPGKMPSMAFICSNHIIYRAATAANDAPNAVLSDDDPTNLNGYIGEVHFYDRVSHAFAIRELGALAGFIRSMVPIPTGIGSVAPIPTNRLRGRTADPILRPVVRFPPPPPYIYLELVCFLPPPYSTL